MRRIQLSSSFFIRLLILSCIIGIFPLSLLGYLSYNQSSSIVQHEVRDSSLLILQQDRAKVEYLLKTTDTLTTQMINSPVTSNAVSMTSVLRLPYVYDHRKLFESLIQKLVQIQVFELGIRDVNLMSFNQNWLINRGVVYNIDSLNTQLLEDAHILELRDQFLEYKHHDELSYWRLVTPQNDNQEYTLKLIKHVPINSALSVGMITVNIPLHEISNRLTQSERLGTVMIIDSHGKIISHPDPNQVGGPIANELFEQTIQHQSSHYFSLVIQDKEYAVIFDHSSYNGWVYISLIPIQDITEKSRAIKWYTFVVALFIVSLVVLFSFLVSKRMYSPIRKLHHFIGPHPTVRERIGNELDYIVEQVEGMVQVQHKMVDQIEVLNRQAREYFVMKLLQGEQKPDEIEEKLEKYGFFTDWDQWCVLAIQVDTLVQTRYVEQDRDLLMFAICNIVGEIVPFEHRLSPVITSQSIVLLMGRTSDASKPFKVAIYNIAEDIQTKVKQFLGLKISLGISRTYEQWVHAPFAYQESLDALTYRIRLGQESILLMEEVQPEKLTDHFKYPKEMEYSLFEAVKQLNYIEAKLQLEHMILGQLEKNINHFDYQIFLGRLFNNMIGMVLDEGGSVQEVFQKDTYWLGEWVKMNSSSEILSWFDQQILTPLIKWLEEQRKSREVNISDEILRMIREDYNRDLTIESCAARLNFHSNYISRVFKKEMGITFSHYLSQYRVDIAKTWLKETDMKISEMAEKLCYSNSSNFNRIFRKFEHMTPTQYREKYK